MHITRNSIDTNARPSEWFTGAVYVDAVATPSGLSRLSASSVHFTPRARTVWHTHPNGQTIYVLGEEHWHGATPNRFMTQLAMLEVDDEGNSATWGDQVSDEEYEPVAGDGPHWRQGAGGRR